MASAPGVPEAVASKCGRLCRDAGARDSVNRMLIRRSASTAEWLFSGCSCVARAVSASPTSRRHAPRPTGPSRIAPPARRLRPGRRTEGPYSAGHRPAGARRRPHHAPVPGSDAGVSRSNPLTPKLAACPPPQRKGADGVSRSSAPAVVEGQVQDQRSLRQNLSARCRWLPEIRRPPRPPSSATAGCTPATWRRCAQTAPGVRPRSHANHREGSNAASVTIR